MIAVEYNIEDSEWLFFLSKRSINSFVKNIFNEVINVLEVKISRGKKIEISIVFTNDKNIKKLNKQFRNINKATNVLSFPIYEKEFFNAIETENYIVMGDIVLSLETIKKESLEQNKTFINHLTHLIIHSILHLFGYDHISDSDAEKMENLEIKILKRLNIENPYL